MKKEVAPTKAGQEYAAAHAIQYKAKNLKEALGLYEGIMIAHPDALESGYSRSQINNIVKSVVPKQELLDAELTMALAHLK